MNYTLSAVHQKLKELSDKMGSDYFVLPVFLNFFETATFDFVGERLDFVEKTQKVTDDIRSLIIFKDLDIIEDPNPTGKYITALPTDYHRLVAHDILYANGDRCRRSDIKRHAEYAIAKLNPNQKPTKEYPIILQYSDLFFIDAGTSVPTKMRITYAKKPSFATVAETNTRIVNLPDESIEKILKITVTNLFSKTGDERTQSSFQLQETYRNVFK